MNGEKSAPYERLDVSADRPNKKDNFSRAFDLFVHARRTAGSSDISLIRYQVDFSYSFSIFLVCLSGLIVQVQK